MDKVKDYTHTQKDVVLAKRNLSHAACHGLFQPWDTNAAVTLSLKLSKKTPGKQFHAIFEKCYPHILLLL